MRFSLGHAFDEKEAEGDDEGFEYSDEEEEVKQSATEPVTVEVEMLEVAGREGDGIRYVNFRCVRGDPFTFARFYKEAQREFLDNFIDTTI